jgi:hypothetical protein
LIRIPVEMSPRRTTARGARSGPSMVMAEGSRVDSAMEEGLRGDGHTADRTEGGGHVADRAEGGVAATSLGDREQTIPSSSVLR